MRAPRKNGMSYRERKEKLMKKAGDLATLCWIPIAVVCSGPDGGAPDVWPSVDGVNGVIDRYLALPAEKRARHTHVDYLRDELDKEKSKLATLQQKGPYELMPRAAAAALDAMSQDELLASIDATLRATAERREALGLLADDDDADGGRLVDADVPLVHHGVPCTGSTSVGVHGYHHQVDAPGNGGRLGAETCNPVHPYNAGVTLTQPGYNGVQYMGVHGVDMNGYHLQMQMPSNGSNNHSQLAWGAFQPCNGFIGRYLALPAEKRARHTHVDYLRGELDKEKAKLATLQQGGPYELAPRAAGAALDVMSQDELQRLLPSIDATLRATAERREALGLLAGDGDADGGQRDADVPPVRHGVPCTGTNSVGEHGYQHQVHAPVNGGRLGLVTCNPFHPYNAGVALTQPGYNDGGHGVNMNVYQLQMRMPSNGSNSHGQLAWGAFQPCNAAVVHVQPGYGHLQCWDNNVDGDQMQPALAAANAGWHNPGTWGNDGEPCNAAVVQPGYGYLQYWDNNVDGDQMQPALAAANAGWHNPGTWGNDGEPCNAAVVQPGYGYLQYWDNNVDGDQTQPALAVATACWNNPGKWGNDGESCNAIVPSAGDPYVAYMDIGGNCIDTTVADHHTPSTGDNFMNAAAQFLTMGCDKSFTNVAGGDETRFSIDDLLQFSDATQNSSSFEQLHYLSDLGDGFDFGSSYDGPLDLCWED